MRLVDTHAHLHDNDFARDVTEVIDRAASAGVAWILTLGVNARNSRDAVALAERDARVFAAAGVHPHDARDATDRDLDDLEGLASHARVVAIGEIGLDFYRNLSPRDQQLRVLRRQLQTAQRVAKPVAVHARDAHEAMLPELERWSRDMGGRLPDGRPLGVLHYFSGDAALAARYVGLGYLISIHTSVTHPKGETLREVAREIPLDRLLIETDSPYGAPQRYRGKRNEPAYVAEAAHKIAEIRGAAPEAVAEATTRNAEALFLASVGAAHA